jgi:ankyrin repeat protein
MRIEIIRKKNNLNQKLRDAFEALDAERVKALLAAGADKKRRVRNELLMSSIGEPCFESNAERTKRMKLLLANGANPNWIDPDPSDFDTPLLESLMCYNFEQAQILIDNGARVDRSTLGEPIFTFLAGRLDGEFAAMKFLYKNGANINIKDDQGRTGLMRVCGFNDVLEPYIFYDTEWIVEPVKFLVSHGAKVNLRDKSGKTALAHSLTQKWGHWDNCICNEDDDCEYAEAKDNFSATFYYEIPKILLSNGAHVGIKDKSGKDALAHAAADEEKMDLFARAIDDSNKFLRRKIVVMSK